MELRGETSPAGEIKEADRLTNFNQRDNKRAIAGVLLAWSSLVGVTGIGEAVATEHEQTYAEIPSNQTEDTLFQVSSIDSTEETAAAPDSIQSTPPTTISTRVEVPALPAPRTIPLIVTQPIPRPESTTTTTIPPTTTTKLLQSTLSCEEIEDRVNNDMPKPPGYRVDCNGKRVDEGGRTFVWEKIIELRILRYGSTDARYLRILAHEYGHGWLGEADIWTGYEGDCSPEQILDFANYFEPPFCNQKQELFADNIAWHFGFRKSNPLGSRRGAELTCALLVEHGVNICEFAK